MRSNLLNLYRANARRGQFRAEGQTLILYDVIVASDADAEWFGGVSAESFTKALRGMSGPVALRINSPGGDVFAGRAMAQAIREYPGEVTAHIDGVAASAASLLAVIAAKTIMAPGSMLMIHNAWTIAMGNAADFTATAGLLEKIDGTLADDYAAKSGKPAADWRPLMDAETWFTAAEAVDIGLADEVAADPRAAAAEPKAQARWDLSAYDRAPTSDTVDRNGLTDAELTRIRAWLNDPATDPADPPAGAVQADSIDQRRRLLEARLLHTPA
jgi:ATP-dependent Clp protease protease subunit